MNIYDKLSDSIITDSTGYYVYGLKPDGTEGIILGENIAKNILIKTGNNFTPAVIFAYYNEYFNTYTQSGALDITLSENTYALPCYIYVTIATDGSAISFPGTWKEIKNDYADDSDNYGLMIFYDGTNYQYSLYLIG